MFIDKKSRLHLLINGEDLGPIAQAIPARRFAVLDLYGCCEEVSIVTADHGERGRVSMEEAKAERSCGKELLLCVNCTIILGRKSNKTAVHTFASFYFLLVRLQIVETPENTSALSDHSFRDGNCNVELYT